MAPRIILPRPDMRTFGRVTKPGVYRMSHDSYIADPCPIPSASAGFLEELLKASPRHARVMHPRLNPRWKPKAPTDAMIRGTILHHLLVGHGEQPFVYDEEDSWQSKRAKRAYAAALEAGRPPVLGKHWYGLKRIAAAARQELLKTEGAPPDLADGEGEVTLIWQEGDMWCRARPDWITPAREGAIMTDLKFTGLDASPEQLGRRTGELGYHFRAAHYQRGFWKLYGLVPGPYIYASLEIGEPVSASLTSPGHAWMAQGVQEWSLAMAIFTACMRMNVWPGYPRQLVYTEAPAYASLQWEETAARAMDQMIGRVPGGLIRDIQQQLVAYA